MWPRGDTQGLPGCKAGVALLRLAHDELEAYGTDGAQRTNEDEMRLILRACRLCRLLRCTSHRLGSGPLAEPAGVAEIIVDCVNARGQLEGHNGRPKRSIRGRLQGFGNGEHVGAGPGVDAADVDQVVAGDLGGE